VDPLPLLKKDQAPWKKRQTIAQTPKRCLQSRRRFLRLCVSSKRENLKAAAVNQLLNYKQAVAVALSEAGMAMKKKDASEDYLRGFIQQILQEEEAMQEEGDNTCPKD
jgi:hypothetical protein